MLFTTARDVNAGFALFDEINQDLYHLFKKNIAGGPSIIFHRYHQAGETKIIGGAETCRKVRCSICYTVYSSLIMLLNSLRFLF